MPEWLIFAVIIFFALRLSRGARCGWGGHARRRIEGRASGAEGRERGPARLGTGDDLRAPQGHARPKPARRPAKRLPERQESPLEALQRRFVNGAMTVEEYERELDELYSKGPRARV